MPFVPAAATVKVQFRYEAFGQQLFNVLWMRDNNDSLNEDDMLDLAQELINRWDSNMAALTSENVTLAEVIVTDWSSDTAPSVNVFAASEGTRTNPALPLNCTLTTTFKTAGRGRSGRGRAYFVGLSENEVNGNTVDSTIAIAIANGWEAVMANFATGACAFQHVVVSFVSEGAPREDALIQPVTSYVVVNYDVDSQKRRLNGRGS